MANFPQQVQTQELSGALNRFYNQKNEEIKSKLQKYQRESVSGATGGENMSELEYNNRQKREAFRNLENGQEKVEIEWYEPVVERSAPPKVSMQKRSFQIEHRYGTWIKHDHDLR